MKSLLEKSFCLMFFSLLSLSYFDRGGVPLPSDMDKCDRGNGDTIIVKRKQNLKGASIKFPDSCVVIIKKGFFKNGTLDLNGAKVIADDYKLVFHPTVKVSSEKKISYCTPFWFAAKGNGKSDDTDPLKRCVELSDNINLCERKFAISNITITSETKIHDGVILGLDSSIVLSAIDAKRISLSRIIIDGRCTASMGLFIKSSKSVLIDSCVFQNFDGGYKQSAGVFFHSSDCITITNTTVRHILSKPNGIIGDGDGSCTGILLELCDNATIANNTIYDLPYPEDSDGIHCNTGVDLKTIYNIIIEENEIFDCAKRCIKVQQRGVVIRNNHLFTSPDYKETINTGISIYSANCKIEKNLISLKTHQPIVIDTKWEHCNISIVDNIIHDMGKMYQGSVMVMAEVSDLCIEGNTITIDNEFQSAIYLRNKCKDVKVSSNYVEGGLYFIWIRTKDDSMHCENLVIRNNETHNTGLFVYNSDKQIEKLNRIELHNNTAVGLNMNSIPRDALLNSLSRGLDVLL